jgi:hypothetical protein
MKRNNLIIFAFFAFVLASGCGETNPTTGGGGTNSAVNAANSSNRNVTPNANANAGNSAISPANGGVPATPNIPANIAGKDIPVPADGAPQTIFESAPPPDDSTVETAFAENLVRTRTFKNHPRLKKVEETVVIAENNRKIVKVYFKNGQVKEIPEGKIKDAISARADDVLKAAG